MYTYLFACNLTSEVTLTKCLPLASWKRSITQAEDTALTSTVFYLEYQCLYFVTILSGQRWQVRFPLRPSNTVITLCMDSCHRAWFRTPHDEVDIFPSSVSPNFCVWYTEVFLEAFHLTQTSVAILAILSMMFLSVPYPLPFDFRSILNE